jgi:hypothetical protein
VSRDISRAALLDALRIAYDEECHNGTATLTDLELVRCIAPRLDALCARRPADPVGLFREVLGRWLARLRARELGPSPDWLARDFGAYIDPPEQRPTVHKVLRALELPDPLDPAETEELAAQARAALVRRVEAVG